MILDTSAIVAMAFAEPERETFTRAIEQADKVLISTVSVVEVRMVVHGRLGQRGAVMVDDLLRLPVFELVAPGVAETNAAYAAFVTFGKGSGHSVGLNFGDLFSYALAKVRGLIPLTWSQAWLRTYTRGTPVFGFHRTPGSSDSSAPPASG
jgi:ribonuclease VapC